MTHFKKHKWTYIGSVLCLVLATAMVVVSSVQDHNYFLESNDRSYLTVFRVLLYTALIFSFAVILKRKNPSIPKSILRKRVITVSTYLIIFEIVVVQNVFGEIFQLIINA